MSYQISIIVPFYNAEKTLERCLNSLFSQTYPDLEICLINDGSTDGSESICQKFIGAYPNIVYVEQFNQGVSAARNKGLEIASASCIAFVDADDWIAPDYCEVLIKNLNQFEADISITEAYFLSENSSIKEGNSTHKINVFTRHEALEKLLLDNEIKSYPWGKLFKKTLFEDITFPVNKQAFEDYATLYKVFEKATKVVMSNQKTYYYVEYPNSLSHDLTPKRAFDFFESVMQMFQFSKSKNLNSSTQKKLRNKTLKQAFMCLKRIIRHQNFQNMQPEFLVIKNALKVFLPYTVFQIKLEYYCYLRILIFFPKYYIKLKRNKST